MPSLVNIDQSATNWYTISLSIIVLILTIKFEDSNKKKEADRFHYCALEIEKIHREYDLRKNNLSDIEVVEYTNRYSDILSSYDINHTKLDWDKVKITSKTSRNGDIFIYSIKSFFINYFILVLLLVLPIVFGILIII